jgi:8-oxo-dGTP pyrophosphatase MutT (NUDIX family)
MSRPPRSNPASPSPNPLLDWPIEARQQIGDHRVFTLHQHRARHPETGDARTFTTLHSVDWVNVMAITPDAQVVYVRQFRHGIETTTVELPGGMVDPGEAPLIAGLRELREETGYEASTWALLGSVQPNPALQNNRCHLVLALDAVPVDTQSLDEGECIEVLTRPLAECASLVFDGTITHSLVVATFFAYRERVGGWHLPDAATRRMLLLDEGGTP